MMYIEHLVLLAGAYNLGFFIELAEYFIFFLFLKLLCVYKDAKQKYFFDFSNCDKCVKMRNNFFLIFKTVINAHKRETAMNHTPVYTFGLGYPPMTKTNLFTIQN